jgi:hypothetical protein
MRPTNTTNSEFELIVAEYLHLLAGKLEKCDVMDAMGQAELACVKQQETDLNEPRDPILRAEQEHAEIDLNNVAFLEGENQILPCDSDLEPKSWAIFVRPDITSDSAAWRFALVGRVDFTMPLDEFIEAAYRFVLNREVDFDGLQTYKRLIEAGRLRRADFLKVLVSSDEARCQKFRFLIVPSPSRWLDAVVSLASGDTSLPPCAAPELAHRLGCNDRSGGDPERAFPITLQFGN